MRVRLTEDLVNHAEPGQYADTKRPGLVLRVTQTGRRTYYARTGRDFMVKIGSARDLTPEAARRRANRVLADFAEGRDPRIERRRRRLAATFKKYIEDTYRPWAAANGRPGIDTIELLLSTRCAMFHEKPLPDITAFDAERWKAERLKEGRTPATVNRGLAALRGALHRAVEERLLSRHPFDGVKPCPEPLDHRIAHLRYLTEAEEQRLLAALDARDAERRAARLRANTWRRERGYDLYPEYGAYTDVLNPLVRFLLLTGCRFGEACQLQWGDVDLASRVAHIRWQTTKARKQRTVGLCPSLVTVLQAWRPEQVDPAALVFPGADAARIVDIKTAWRRLVKAARIPHFRIHDLRHTFASRLVQRGIDLNRVRELLGHADIKMTLRYARLAPKDLVEAVAVLG